MTIIELVLQVMSVMLAVIIWGWMLAGMGMLLIDSWRRSAKRRRQTVTLTETLPPVGMTVREEVVPLNPDGSFELSRLADNQTVRANPDLPGSGIVTTYRDGRPVAGEDEWESTPIG